MGALCALPSPRTGAAPPWQHVALPPGAFQKLGLLLAGAGLCGWGLRPGGPGGSEFQACGFGVQVLRLSPRGLSVG